MMAQLPRTVDIECELYHDSYRHEVIDNNDVNIGSAVFTNNYKYDFWVKSMFKGYWRGYIKVPKIWFDAVSNMFESKDHQVITQNELKSLPEITFMGRSNIDDSYILGFDHAHYQDILKYTNLEGVIQEIQDTYNFCWLPIWETTST